MNEPLPARYEENTAKSFEETYRRYFAMVYRVSFSYMKNEADTEDVVADVFSKLLKSNMVFMSDEHEKAWLLRTAINGCKDSLKHWWRKRESIADFENLQGSSHLHVDETLVAVMNLPKRYKDVVYLYYYEGYTTEQIAEMIQIPHSTIRSHLREARNILKGVLEDEG